MKAKSAGGLAGGKVGEIHPKWSATFLSSTAKAGVILKPALYGFVMGLFHSPSPQGDTSLTPRMGFREQLLRPGGTVRSIPIQPLQAIILDRWDSQLTCQRLSKLASSSPA
jgi:hypothetical protein